MISILIIQLLYFQFLFVMKHTATIFKISQFLLFGSFLFDLLICPHSKVEESFQLQATHDLFYYGIQQSLLTSSSSSLSDDTLPYDHLKFPGVVPRTFCGPIILAFLCQTLRLLLLPILDIAIYPMFVQFLARFFLLTILAHGWFRVAKTLSKQQNNDLGSWFLIITACQFHMPYYASRMLPNIFALAFILHGIAAWINGNITLSVIVMCFATTVFRCDLLLFVGSCGIYWVFVSKKLPIIRALKLGVTTAICSLLLTVPLDSILWQRLVWPEGQVFYYNTVLGKSSNWGTSPWYWYFLSALPKSMLLTIMLIPLSSLRIVEYLGAVEAKLWQKKKKSNNSNIPSMNMAEFVDTKWLEYLIPTTCFIVLYSFLGHKEMRFIFPALPVLNVAAAAGMSRLTNLAFPPVAKKDGMKSSWIARLAFACGLLCLVLTLVGSLTFVAVSRWNYPGGDALATLATYVQQKEGQSENVPMLVNVYIDVASSMSGVSLFGQRAAQASTPGIKWNFVKGGYEQQNQLGDESFHKFTHLLSENPNAPTDFRVIDTIQGNPRINLKSAKVSTNEAIYIMERITWDDL